MNFNDEETEMLASAREDFKQSKYSSVEPVLNQLILQGKKSPEIFHMLGTIYYDRGKFNKAIRAFQRALELDPAFTDASVGLSIILNDLGRYEEGQKIFDEAKVMLQQKDAESDPYINEKLSVKHDELGELYFHYQRYNEALEQYLKASRLSTRKAELGMKLVETYLKLGEDQKAIRDLRSLCLDFPEFHNARVRLGQIYYDSGKILEAIEQWEQVLKNDPNHKTAQQLLNQAQAVEYMDLTETTL